MTHSRPPIVRFLKKYKSHFAVAGKLLDLREKVRSGDVFDRALAMTNAVGLIADVLYPGSDRWHWDAQVPDHHPLNLSIGGFLCDILHDSPLAKNVISLGEMSSRHSVVVWPSLAVSATYEGTSFSYGPFGTEGGEEGIQAAVQKLVWSKGIDYMLATSPEDPSRCRKGSGRFRLEEMYEPGVYVGEKTPAEYARRLSEHASGEARSVLLIGPSGAGKSVLARLIAREMMQGKKEPQRTLKIASNVLKTCRYDEVLGLVVALKPTVLLLDDCNLADAKYTEEFLSLLEAVRRPGCLVIVTMMTEKAPEDMKRGALCFPGMRPGRIDETFVLGYPVLGDRVKILRHYLAKTRETDDGFVREVAEATEGITGAYLREVARRISLHGVSSWKQEVDNVLRTAPALATAAPASPGSPTPASSGVPTPASSAGLVRG